MSTSHANWPRVIVHADMDAFYASVEQLDDPKLRGKPLIVGPRSARGVVLTASYEARPFGVHSAMPMVEAMRLCPDALIVPPRFSRYQEVSGRIMEAFRDFSPHVEPLSLDEAFLDMSGAEDCFGPPQQLGSSIKSAVKAATGGLTVSVGISATKYVAKVASGFRKPDGLTIVPAGDAKAWLSPMHVGALWGAGRKTQKRLETAGFSTIGQVAAADPSVLEAKFGKMGLQFHRLANAEDARAVVSNRAAKSISSERTFETDIAGQKEIEYHLSRAADDVGRRLRREGYEARGVRIKLKTNRFDILSRQLQLPDPTHSNQVLYRAALTLVPKLIEKGPFRLVGLGAFDLTRPDNAGQQGFDFDDGSRKGEELEAALDAVEKRFGPGTLQRGARQIRTQHVGVAMNEPPDDD